MAQGFLQTNPRSEYMALTVRLALARALLDGNKNLQAAREYEVALARPMGRIPAAYYGLARASERLGNAERAGQLLSCVTSSPGADLRNRILLADQYYQDYDDAAAIGILSGLTKLDPANLAVLIRLGRLAAAGGPHDGAAGGDVRDLPADPDAVADQRPRPPGDGPLVRHRPELPQVHGAVRPDHRHRPELHDPAARAGADLVLGQSILGLAVAIRATADADARRDPAGRRGAIGQPRPAPASGVRAVHGPGRSPARRRGATSSASRRPCPTRTAACRCNA